MIIKTHVSLDSAHKLNLSYGSKCNDLHGHRWEIDVTIWGNPDKTGMIIDFTEIKKYFKDFDHCCLNKKLSKVEPTAENLAIYFACGVHCLSGNIENVEIQIAETPKNVAVYRCK